MAEQATVTPSQEKILTVAIDIDGTLDANTGASAFFRFLTTVLRSAGQRIVILSHRPFNRNVAEGQLAAWGIVYDHLFWVNPRADKGEVCRKLGIDVLFDDSDECIAGVDDGTMVFKARNAFNFDFEARKWLGSTEFTKMDYPADPAPGY